MLKTNFCCVSLHALHICTCLGALSLADMLRLMRVCRKLREDVLRTIPLMPVINFHGYEHRVKEADVWHVLRLHGPSKCLRELDMRMLVCISVFTQQRLLSFIDSVVSGVSLGTPLKTDEKMHVSLRLVRRSRLDLRNEIWLCVSNIKKVDKMWNKNTFESDSMRQNAIFFEEPDENGKVAAMMRNAFAFCDPAHGLKPSKTSKQGSILNIVYRKTKRKTRKTKRKTNCVPNTVDVFLGYAETEDGYIARSTSTCQLFYAYYMMHNKRMTSVEDAVKTIPWRLVDSQQKLLKENLREIEALDTRIMQTLPFEVLSMDNSSATRLRARASALSEDFKVSRKGICRSIESILRQQREAVDDIAK